MPVMVSKHVEQALALHLVSCSIMAVILYRQVIQIYILSITTNE